MISLKALSRAFEPIRKVGRGESTFEVEGLPVVIRSLLPWEELAVLKYAREAFAGAAAGEDGARDESQMLDYLDRYKVETLAYSIIKVGTVDFRGEALIITDEIDEEGNNISVQKHVAVRQLLRDLGRQAILAMFRKVGELAAKVEIEAEKAVEFDAVDFDAEIERLEERLQDIRDMKEKAEQDRREKNPVIEHMERAMQAEATAPSTIREDEGPQEQEPGEDPEPPTAHQPRREAAPVRHNPPAAVGRRAPIIPRQAPAPAPRPVPAYVGVEGEDEEEAGSFVDVSDPQDMDRAYRQEAARIRQQAPHYQPPHRAAQQTAEELAPPPAARPAAPGFRPPPPSTRR